MGWQGGTQQPGRTLRSRRRIAAYPHVDDAWMVGSPWSPNIYFWNGLCDLLGMG